MEELIIPRSEESDAAFALGEILGGRHAFSHIAGRCSAADAEALRMIRDQKMYKVKCDSWEEFCPRYLRMSKTNANRVIRLLEEFGSGYFEVAQLTRMTPEEYRQLAPDVRNHALNYNGEAIALIPQNAEKIETLVNQVRKAARRAAKPAQEEPPKRQLSRRARIQQLRKAGEDLAAEFADLARTRSSRADNPSLGDIRNSILSDLYQVDLIR